MLFYLFSLYHYLIFIFIHYLNKIIIIPFQNLLFRNSFINHLQILNHYFNLNKIIYYFFIFIYHFKSIHQNLLIILLYYLYFVINLINYNFKFNFNF